MNQIIQWSAGNPGALTFLMALTMELENMVHLIPITLKLTECESIRGTNLYILWSDLANKDMAVVAQLCEACPNSVLEDACSRQDCSGRELVKKYLN